VCVIGILDYRMDSPGDSTLALFSMPSGVRGYHVYQNIWDALIREELPCQREDDEATTMRLLVSHQLLREENMQAGYLIILEVVYEIYTETSNIMLLVVCILLKIYIRPPSKFLVSISFTYKIHAGGGRAGWRFIIHYKHSTKFLAS